MTINNPLADNSSDREDQDLVLRARSRDRQALKHARNLVYVCQEVVDRYELEIYWSKIAANAGGIRRRFPIEIGASEAHGKNPPRPRHGEDAGRIRG